MTDAIPHKQGRGLLAWGKGRRLTARGPCPVSISLPPGDPGQAGQRVWGPDGPTWLQMPGFVCEGEESWGLGEKSSLLEGMQELLCESRVLQEAWGPCRSFGCRPRPEDDTSLLRRETSI